MIKIFARCPCCDQTVHTHAAIGQPVDCPACQHRWVERCPDFDPQDRALRCVTCPSNEFFVRKDFSQRLGVSIVVLGFAASSVAWFYRQVLWSFGILFATALIDVVLYVVMGDLLECYRCHAQYRGLPSLEGHTGHNLEVHEKYRQQAARTKSNGRENQSESLRRSLPG